ncbi:MAG: DMT family transporter [Alphaproteobacteria bacterium]|nr:DMT family transporter [Alphaproteobacteria bacterium]
MRAGCLDALGVILIWSGFILVSRMGGRSPLLAYDVTALRFGVAALLLFPFWIMRNQVRILQPRMLVLGFSGGIGYALLAYLGFKYAPATHAAILLPGMLPFEITLFSWLLQHERPSRWRVAGLTAIAAGVACLAADTFTGKMAAAWKGDLAFIGASTLWALYTVLARKWRVDVWDATIGVVMISALLYVPVYLFALPKQLHASSWEIIAIQGFYQGVLAVIVAMALYMRAVRALGATQVGLCMALVPVISGFAAVPLLGESLTAAVLLGLALTSFGTWVGSRG